MIEIVRYSGEWCTPCKMMDSVFDLLNNELPDIKISKIDIDENPEAAQQMGIRSIPTMVFYKDGVLKYKQVGAVPISTLRNIISNF